MSTEAPIPLASLLPAGSGPGPTIESGPSQTSHPNDLDQNDPPTETTSTAMSINSGVPQSEAPPPASLPSPAQQDEGADAQEILFYTRVQTWFMGFGLINVVQVIAAVIFGIYAVKGARWLILNTNYQSCIDSIKIPGRRVSKQCNDTLDGGPPIPPMQKRDFMQVTLFTDTAGPELAIEIMPWLAHIVWFTSNIAQRYMQGVRQAPNNVLISMHSLLLKFLAGCLIIGLYAEALFSAMLMAALLAVIYSCESLFCALQRQISKVISYQSIEDVEATSLTLDSVLVTVEDDSEWDSVPHYPSVYADYTESSTVQIYNSSLHDDEEEDTVYFGAFLERMWETAADDMTVAASTSLDPNTSLTPDGCELRADNAAATKSSDPAAQDVYELVEENITAMTCLEPVTENGHKFMAENTTTTTGLRCPYQNGFEQTTENTAATTGLRCIFEDSAERRRRRRRDCGADLNAKSINLLKQHLQQRRMIENTEM